MFLVLAYKTIYLYNIWYYLFFMLFLPRELHCFLLDDAIKRNISYYDELRNAAFEYAEKKGFEHKHRFKKVGIAKGTICVICGRDTA